MKTLQKETLNKFVIKYVCAQAKQYNLDVYSKK